MTLTPLPPVTLPDGVSLLSEPVGWQCEACGGGFTVPDSASMRAYPDMVVEALESSAAQHSDSCGR